MPTICVIIWLHHATTKTFSYVAQCTMLSLHFCVPYISRIMIKNPTFSHGKRRKRLSLWFGVFSVFSFFATGHRYQFWSWFSLLLIRLNEEDCSSLAFFVHHRTSEGGLKTPKNILKQVPWDSYAVFLPVDWPTDRIYFKHNWAVSVTRTNSCCFASFEASSPVHLLRTLFCIHRFSMKI